MKHIIFIAKRKILFFFFITLSVLIGHLSASAQDTTYVTYLNAANFDFSPIGKTNYLGHFNVTYLPFGRHKFGWSAGLMKINYNSDSTQKALRFRNITEDPLKPINVGTKYYKQSSYLSTIVTNSAYSIYAQPTYELWEDGKGNRILLHGHVELLAFTVKATTKYGNTQQEEATFTAKDSINHLSVYQGNYKDTSNTITSRTQTNGYFGAGLTFVLKASNVTFNFQGTLGTTDNFPDFQHYLRAQPPTFNKWRSFYLIRGNFGIDLTDRSKIILGTDIRGLFPDYEPLYAVYVGLNLDVSDLKKLFTSK